MRNLARVIEDFFTKKFILLSILPAIFSVIIFGFLVFFGGSELYLNLIENPEILASKESFFGKFLSYDFAKFLIILLISTAGFFLVLVLSFLSATLISGFLTPVVTRFVNQKYYNKNIENLPNFALVMKLLVVTFFKFILIFVAILPFLLIPFVNLVILNIPFFYLYYKFMLIDVASNTLNLPQFHSFIKESGNFKFYCFLFYCLSLIPLFGLFFQLFFVMFLSHIVYENFKGKV